MAQLLVDLVGRLRTLDIHELLDAGAHIFLGLVELGCVGLEAGHLDLVGKVVLHCVGEHEVTVGQTLHEGGGAEAVRAVVGEVALADGEEALDGGLELVVYPDTAHGVVGGGEDHHRGLVGVVVGDHLVHVEEVAVAVGHSVLAQTVDGIFEVEVNGVAGTYAVAGVAAFFGGT